MLDSQKAQIVAKATLPVRNTAVGGGEMPHCTATLSQLNMDSVSKLALWSKDWNCTYLESDHYGIIQIRQVHSIFFGLEKGRASFICIFAEGNLENTEIVGLK